jgi:hypothetical protein
MRARTVLAACAVLALLVYLASGGRGWPAGDAGIYKSPLVSPAPVNPLDEDRASTSFRFEDARGVYERHVFPGDAGARGGGEPPYVNLLFTRSGYKRSGDIHKCEQLNHIIYGHVQLTRVLRSGREVTSRHRGGDVVRVPPHVPHLYSYESDTLMSETWRHADGTPCVFQAWFYTPLRSRIPAATAEKRFTAAGEQRT